MGKGRRVHRGAALVFSPNRGSQGSSCLGCYRHPGLSGKLLVIAWLLVWFCPPNLKGLWYLQKSHSSMCCGNNTLQAFRRRNGESCTAGEIRIFHNHLYYIVLCWYYPTFCHTKSHSASGPPILTMSQVMWWALTDKFDWYFSHESGQILH